MAASNTQTSDQDGLKGRVAVVTGAASGMGRVMAIALAATGARIAAVDVQSDVETILRRNGKLDGHDIYGITADLSDPRGCERAAQSILDHFGTCEILINCAGISMGPVTPPGIKGLPRFWEVDPDGLVRLLAINTNGPLLMARYLAPAMISRGWGRIVNVTTSFDTMLGKGMSAYGASKAALEASSAIWAAELMGTGVTVNILVPGGMTATPFLPPEMRKGALDPDVMRAPICWLASMQSDGMTGRRFVASLWDEKRSAADNAMASSAPAAWADLAEKARQLRK